jgi:hypothetical protein
VGELFEVNGVKLVDWEQLFLFFSTVIINGVKVGLVIPMHIQLDHAEVIYGDEEMMAIWNENRNDDRVFERKQT